MQEYKDFQEFYNNSYILSQIAIQEIGSARESVEYARKHFNRDDLNNYYNIGNLSIEQKNLIQSKTNEIKFSVDSLVKNIIKHPEIDFSDYLKVREIISHPDKMRLSKSNNNSILLLKKEGKYYQAVIKTTKARTENYLTSFRMLSEEDYNRQ